MPNGFITMRYCELYLLRLLLYEKMLNLEELFIQIPDECLWSGMFTYKGYSYLPRSIPLLPNIKRLHFGSKYIGRGSFDTPILIKELPHSSINLVEVNGIKPTSAFIGMSTIFHLAKKYYSHQVDDIVDSLNNATFPDNERTIWRTILSEENQMYFPQMTKIVMTHYQIGTTELILLYQKRFQLQHLELRCTHEIDHEVLSNVLNTYSNTMKILKIQFYRNVIFNLNLRMDKLSEIYLRHYSGSLSFIENLPNLKKLILAKINAQAIESTKEFSRPHFTLEWLEISEVINTKVPEKCVASLATKFPYVTKLRLEKLHNDGLQIVFCYWQYLQSLDLADGKFDDQAITGIHPNASKVILREGSFDAFNADILRQGYHLGCLKYLEKLSIHLPNITDISFILGVAKCRNIRHLSILAYGITDASLYRFISDMNLLHLKTQFCNQLTIPAASWITNILKTAGSSVSINQYEGPYRQSEILKFIQKNYTSRVTMPKLGLIPNATTLMGHKAEKLEKTLTTVENVQQNGTTRKRVIKEITTNDVNGNVISVKRSKRLGSNGSINGIKNYK